MSTVKIEHVNPLTSKPIAFDIMAAARKDKDGHDIKTVKNPDGSVSYPDGTIVTVDREGREIRETIVLTHGQFRIIELSGGLMLHEVSVEEIAERERKLRERQELEAEVARERKARDDAVHAERVAAERAEAKAEIERLAGDPKKPADDDEAFRMKTNEKPPLIPSKTEPKSESVV